MRRCEKIEKFLLQEGAESFVNKMSINDGEHEHDFYLKVAWWRGRPVWIDITKSRNSVEIDNGGDVLETVLQGRLTDSTRSFMEIVCREASLLLSSRRCSLEDIAELWRVTQTEPKGTCQQVADAMGTRVHGPLDAAAKMLRLKAKDWVSKMAYEYKDEEIDDMLQDCLAAIDERPDDFTEWEMDFIRDTAEANETLHLSKPQIEKLEQIWEERDCG